MSAEQKHRRIGILLHSHLSELEEKLPKDCRCVCHLWQLPKGWPRKLIGRSRYGKRIYRAKVHGDWIDFFIDPMNLSGGRFCAVVYREVKTGKLREFIPIILLNVTKDKIVMG